MEDKYWRRFKNSIKESPENDGWREQFIDIMTQSLKKKPKYLDYIVPDFRHNRRRLTPGPGYLATLTEDNVELIETPVERFTEDGIVVGGHQRQVHAVICATSANIDTVPTFSIQANGLDLSEAWRTRWQDWWAKNLSRTGSS